jgi:CO/xanthine dehydrogenase Mo-binding subunit
MTREEVFRGSGPTSGATVEVKIGANRDGSIVAAQQVLKFQAGAFPGSPVQPGCMCGFALYDLPNVDVVGYDVVSNRPKTAAYRATGAPITSFAVESLLDDLARKLHIDPLTLRQKNAARNGSKTHYGPSHQNIGFETVLQTVKNHPHWRSPVKPGHGRGFACGFWFNVGGESTAQVHINEDGSVTAATGSPDIGGSRASWHDGGRGVGHPGMARAHSGGGHDFDRLYSRDRRLAGDICYRHGRDTSRRKSGGEAEGTRRDDLGNPGRSGRVARRQGVPRRLQRR